MSKAVNPAIGACLAAFMLAAPQARALDRFEFEVRGGDSSLPALLRGASLLATADANGNHDPQELMAAARADYARILGALYSEAYYGATINILIDGREAASIPTISSPASMGAIRVEVVPGPVFDFGATAFAPLAPGTVLPRGLHGGWRAHSTLIQQSADAAVSGWRDAGHAKAAVARQTITADHQRDLLNLDVALAPGPRVTFGKVTVEGAGKVREARIHTIANIPEGEVFDPEAISEAARRLRRTGSFASVAVIEADHLEPGDVLPMGITVVDALPRRFGFGAEVSSSEGAALSGFWMHRNLLGGAENLRIDGEASGIGGDTGGPSYSLGATYRRPATLSADTDLTVMALVERKDERDYDTDNLIFGVGLEHYFSEDLTGRIGVEYGRYRVDEYGMKRTYNVFSLPGGVTWDRRDNRLDPSNGFYIDTTLRPFYGLDETGSGARLTLDGRGFWSPLAGDMVVLAGRVQVGSVMGPGLLDTPRDYLFYSGGGGTVRGQPYQSLALPYPGHPDRSIGGRQFLGVSGEVRTRITDTYGLVAFYDAGYLSENAFFEDDGRWQSGYGIGGRYNTGIGPIRIDLAMPAGGNTGNGLQIYVGIGQAF